MDYNVVKMSQALLSLNYFDAFRSWKMTSILMFQTGIALAQNIHMAWFFNKEDIKFVIRHRLVFPKYVKIGLALAQEGVEKGRGSLRRRIKSQSLKTSKRVLLLAQGRHTRRHWFRSLKASKSGYWSSLKENARPASRSRNVLKRLWFSPEWRCRTRYLLHKIMALFSPREDIKIRHGFSLKKR